MARRKAQAVTVSAILVGTAPPFVAGLSTANGCRVEGHSECHCW